MLTKENNRSAGVHERKDVFCLTNTFRLAVFSCKYLKNSISLLDYLFLLITLILSLDTSSCRILSEIIEIVCSTFDFSCVGRCLFCKVFGLPNPAHRCRLKRYNT